MLLRCYLLCLTGSGARVGDLMTGDLLVPAGRADRSVTVLGWQINRHVVVLPSYVQISSHLQAPARRQYQGTLAGFAWAPIGRALDVTAAAIEIMRASKTIRCIVASLMPGGVDRIVHAVADTAADLVDGSATRPLISVIPARVAALIPA